MKDTSESNHNKFTFYLKDDSVEYMMEFQEAFTDKIVYHFANFLQGCGHSEGSIAAAMKEVSDEYLRLSQMSTEIINKALGNNDC